ncbi:1-deoxy-D-xylulose-5-phosphate reductoisomerase [Candidatus Kinetoplastibacterium blastocrithidii TCC012E]|uniref:1-deoxy-D-xylulose 5-phosphate reductoisomerase n=1 Tax=Candidatus Kinetoplastidibacterium blastocrithidiae TCC012E TaxID=1208922 RepID=M1M0G1_9PROT|nr:1-deoxy-D-xylulose-5-phosphate reductoisomerase [Candidatus Kinetoplastibacterium blastocrithidii]AFZ83635.1 1-deoxy-D-xylulose-5-phosphate reductoisomerase [Candidatus Kinetoplastibacterium blastocrithidii (ex Strigomonas culicis)]AGF49756.1 1-deoxy-D-xylulose-5-phosphate reductoisomerase [Candidatus Kinetoplastibacterium blastocrithidii TCC012E]
MSALRRVFIFGSTGSIGKKTLEIIDAFHGEIEVFGLSAYSKIDDLVAQAIKYKVKVVVVPNVRAKEHFYEKWIDKNSIPKLLLGPESLVDMAYDTSYDTVIAAIVGIAGLASALAAAKSGKRILLANKEVLVVAGSLFMQYVADNNAEIIPIDSEHNAIFQCLCDNNIGIDFKKIENTIRRIVLTASGGPFRTHDLERLQAITPEQACLHPSWDMGRKISVDSSTMINKGFEVIETHWLFHIPIKKIEIIIHPQSIIHSMVEYIDGSILAQLSKPDMGIPISYALGFPNRTKNEVGFIDFIDLRKLEFYPPDFVKFPCLSLALEALKLGQAHCIVLNAANEVAVESFLNGTIKYINIPKIIENSIEWYEQKIPYLLNNLDDILHLDMISRSFAYKICHEE